MSCCESFLNFIIKYFLFIFNFLCVIVGAGLIVIGSLFLSGVGELNGNDIPYAEALPILTIVLGSIIFVVAFFGCCGAIRENSCMLTTYTIFLILLCAAQIAFSTYCWVKREQIIDEADGYVQTAWDKHEQQPEILDGIQLLGQCCGKDSYRDFGLSPLPASCCGFTNTNYACSRDEAYQSGCFAGLADYFRKYTNWVIIYGYIIAAIELAGVILACCLKGTLKRNERTF